MSELVRFGVSLDKELLDKFDDLIKRRNYTNRSEAIRDLIRKEFVEDEWNSQAEVAGAITITYDHHIRELGTKLTDIQHHHIEEIVSTQHIHLDHNNCLEIIAVRGKASEVIALADKLKSIRGVKHGTLSMTSTGSSI